MDDTAKRSAEISRREFGRIAVLASAASTVAAPIASAAVVSKPVAEAPATEAAQASGTPSAADLKPKPALTTEQAPKLDEALGRLAAQLGQMRKHTLPYSTEPAFVFKAEPPHRSLPALSPKG